VKVAAVQLEVRLGDVAHNLAECERLARAAAAEGAELIALPEFFPTGAAFLREVAEATMPEEGPAKAMLTRVAREAGVYLGGSFLCLDPDGEVRNAFLLAGPDGTVLGRHDKDLPTMWENALYVGGEDDGIIDAGAFTVGAAVCWEFMRTQTPRRLQGKVDLVMGGSNWWSVPWFPRLERANAATALRAPSTFGRYVGAPVVHAAIAGRFSCPQPEMPAMTYRGHFQGGALVAAADGSVLALRTGKEGSGYVVAEVEVGRRPPLAPIPDRYWLHKRGAMGTFVWNSQRIAGRRWYRRQNPARARD
jgi:predicted amidohydrolase